MITTTPVHDPCPSINTSSQRTNRNPSSVTQGIETPHLPSLSQSIDQSLTLLNMTQGKVPTHLRHRNQPRLFQEASTPPSLSSPPFSNPSIHSSIQTMQVLYISGVDTRVPIHVRNRQIDRSTNGEKDERRRMDGRMDGGLTAVWKEESVFHVLISSKLML